MKTIKFSEDYEKLPKNWEGTQAVLFGVSLWSIDTLKTRIPQFIEFDTKYRGKEGYYNLDFDNGLVLTFFHLNTRTFFVTIRRFTIEKEDYYRKLVGDTFQMERTKQNAT